MSKTPSPAMPSTVGARSPAGPSGLGHWLAALGAGLLAGLGAGFVMTVVMTLLRLLAGVPLPGELGADRFLPLLPVFTFLNTIGRFGGNVHAKELAFWSGFAGQVALGAALGVVYAAIVERERSRAPERRWALASTGAARPPWRWSSLSSGSSRWPRSGRCSPPTSRAWRRPGPP